MSDRTYWDANVLCSWVEEQPDRHPLLELLLGDARSGAFEIVTSLVSHVEVAWTEIERLKQVLDPEVDKKIADLFAPGSVIKTVEVYPSIASRARNLMREALPRGWSLKPMDAVHLATAQHMMVKAFHTYDDRLEKYAEVLGFEITEPRTEHPRIA